MSQEVAIESSIPVLLEGAAPRGPDAMPGRAYLVLGWGLSLIGALLILFGLASQFYPLQGDTGPAIGWLGTVVVGLSAALAYRGAGSLGRDYLRYTRLRRRPDNHWLADHGWDETWCTEPNLARASVYAAAAGLVLAAPLHWLTFSAIPLALRLCLAVGCLLVDAWMVAHLARARRLVRLARHFGAWRVRLERFPFFLNQDMDVTVFAAGREEPGLLSLTATLRCVEERIARTRYGRKSQWWEIYRETQVVALSTLPDGLKLRFFLPSDGKPTILAQHPVCYWELCLHLRRGEQEHDLAFLLPIYSLGG